MYNTGDNMEIKRGDIYLVNLGELDGTSIQKGICRPCIIVSHPNANTYSTVLHVIPVTSKSKKPLPTHVIIGTDTGLKFESIAMAEQNMPIARENLIRKVGECNNKTMHMIDKSLLIQFGLFDKVMVSIKNAVIKSKNKERSGSMCVA
jgi:mRNA-degrading endonuclease toxin of MazEF toxin-antitoxin module